MNNIKIGDNVREKYVSHRIIAKVIGLDDKRDLATVEFEHNNRTKKSTVHISRLIKV